MHEWPKVLPSAGLRIFFFLLISGIALPAAGQRYWDTNGRTSGSSSGTTALGTWGVDNFWSTSSSGTGNTSAWTPGQQAVFSAGGNATGTFTVGVSGNQLTSGILFQEGNITLNGGILTLTNGVGNATISVASNYTANVTSSLRGNSDLVKTGTGTLILSGTNSYTGVTDLQQGTLLVGKPTSLGSSTLDLDGGTFGAFGGPVVLNNAVLLDSDSTIGGTSDLTFTGTFLAEGGPRLLTISNPGNTVFAGSSFTLGDPNRKGTVTLDVLSGNVTISGVIQNGAGARPDGIVKSGNGSLLLTGNNTFSGGLELNGGTLFLGNNNALGSGTLTLDAGVTLAATNGDRTISNPLSIQGNVTFAGPNALILQSSFNLRGNRTFTIWNTTTFNGVISGRGDSLTKLGTGNLILGGTSANTFSGGFNINAGTVTAAKVNALGTGPLSIGSATLNIANYNQSVGTFTLAGGTLTGTSGTLTASSFQLQSGTVGAVLAGSGALVKSTAGTVTLSTASTFSGGSTLSAGTLRVINTTGSATGTGTVTVNSGATLTGSGSISGSLILNSGALLAPGDPVGTLSTANETWNGGAHLVTQMKDALSGAGIGWDLLRITGTLTIHGSASNPLYVDLQSLTLAGSAGPVYNFNSSLAYNWKIVTTTGGIAFDAGQNVSSAFRLNLGSFANSTAGGSFSFTLANGNKDVMLNYAPGAVPEPNTLVMVSIGFGILLLQRRFVLRRRN